MRFIVLAFLLATSCAGRNESRANRPLELEQPQTTCCQPSSVKHSVDGEKPIGNGSPKNDAFEICEFRDPSSATCLQWTANYGVIYSTHMPNVLGGASFELGSATPSTRFWAAPTSDETCLLLVHPTTNDQIVSQRAASHCPQGHQNIQRRSVAFPEPIHGREALITTAEPFEWREQTWSLVDVAEDAESLEATLQEMFEPSKRLARPQWKPVPPYIIVRVGHWSGDRPVGWPQWADTTAPRDPDTKKRLHALIESYEAAIQKAH